MERDSVRIAREAWRKPPDYPVRGREITTSLDLVEWARRPPYVLWIVKWPLALLGLVILWLGAAYAGSSADRRRQFPEAK